MDNTKTVLPTLSFTTLPTLRSQRFCFDYYNNFKKLKNNLTFSSGSAIMFWISCTYYLKSRYKRPKGNLTIENLKKMLIKLPKSIQFIGLNGLGEPLLNKDFFKIIAACRSHIPNVGIGFHTNGSMLNKETIESILASGANDVSISIDAVKADTYTKVHKCNYSLNVVVENVKELINKRNMEDSNLRVTLSYVIQKENLGELKDFLLMADDLGPDLIGPIDLINPLWGYPIEQWDDPKHDIAVEIKSAKDISKSMKVKVDFPDLDNNIPGSANIEPIVGASCSFPFCLYPIITWDGFVFPCVWLQNIEEDSVGNILDDSCGFDEIWDGDKIRYIRKTFMENRYLKNCINCKPGGLPYKKMEIV